MRPTDTRMTRLVIQGIVVFIHKADVALTELCDNVSRSYIPTIRSGRHKTMDECIIKRIATGSVFFLSLFLTFSVQGQNARFFGEVTDSQNAAIPGAAIEITNEDTGVHLQTTT